MNGLRGRTAVAQAPPIVWPGPGNVRAAGRGLFGPLQVMHQFVRIDQPERAQPPDQSGSEEGGEVVMPVGHGGNQADSVDGFEGRASVRSWDVRRVRLFSSEPLSC